MQLLAGGCRVVDRRGVELHRSHFAAAADAATLLAAADTALSEIALRRKHGSATAVVSDHVALTAIVPWQAELTRPEELQRYGAACLRAHGLEDPASYLVHTEFRTYGMPGLAYALPVGWTQALVDVFGTHGWRLQSLLPASPATFFSMRRLPRHGVQLNLLHDAATCAAMLCDHGGLLCHDVEPVIGNPMGTLVRLLSRMKANVEEVSAVRYISMAEPGRDIADCVASLWPAARMEADIAGYGLGGLSS
ncbi:hypothetical protein E4K72_05560 [Oxalobacteraceae bacterium OM1]|nr:hypothetical protein E4K72_05560 [Oxalobacteraceae bacterium OM1]